MTRKGDIYADWASYIQDIAFQTYVFQQAFPHFRIEPYLLLADKRTQCPTDGLNQKFLLKQEDSDRKVIVVTSTLTQEERSQRILAKVSVDEAIQVIFENKDRNLGKTFQETVEQFSTAYKDNQKIWSPIGKECANCEFKVTLDEEKQGCKSGFKECWSNHLNWQETDFNEPTILELWNYRKKEELIAKGVCKLSDVAEDMLDVKKDDKPGMSTSERQMQQWVQYENNVVKNPYKLLPNIFTNISEKDHILLTQEDEINNGSAALTAYAKIQSTEIDTKERTALKAGLLRYCELDTLAMVMIFEGWKNWE